MVSGSFLCAWSKKLLTYITKELKGYHHQRAHALYHTAIVLRHARPKRVEDADDADVDTVLFLEGVAQCLPESLCLVVAGAGSDRVDVSPVVFGLWRHFRVAVDLRRGGKEDACADDLCKFEQVGCPDRVCLDGSDAVNLRFVFFFFFECRLSLSLFLPFFAL